MAAQQPTTGSRGGFALTFPADVAAHVAQEYAKAEVVLEYGSGGSTFLALDRGAKAVFSVESDKAWADNVAEALDREYPEKDHTVVYADIGPTKNWGYPKTLLNFSKFAGYARDVWDREGFQQPDVVLIDGRFRTACFLEVVRRCQKKAVVLFDDYTNRSRYHWVEKIVKPTQIIDRMAHFIVEPGLQIKPSSLRTSIATLDPR